ncbi:muddled meiosis-related protein [Saitoella coloradoensis]
MELPPNPPTLLSQSSTTSTADPPSSSTPIPTGELRLKAILRKKEADVQSLLQEVQRLSTLLSGGGGRSGQLTVDPAIDRAFRTLKTQLGAKDEEIGKLREDLDVFSASDTVNAVPLETSALIRRLHAKLSQTLAENRTLGSMLSASRSAQRELELSLRVRENDVLRARVLELEGLVAEMDREQEEMVGVVEGLRGAVGRYEAKYGKLD